MPGSGRAALFAGTLGSGDNPAELVQDFYGAPMYWSHFDGEPTGSSLRDAGFQLLEADEIEDEGETPAVGDRDGLTVGLAWQPFLRATHPDRR